MLPSSSPALSIVINYVFPITGSVLGFLMALAPIKAVKHAERIGRLGHLNPLPSCIFLLNCSVWLLYGAAIKDPFVFCANVPSIPVSLHLILHSYALARPPLRSSMETTLLSSSLLLLVLGLLYVFLPNTHIATKINGMVAMLVMITLYASPLATLSKVIKTKSSASIYLPFTFAALGCSSMWMIYGLAIKQVPVFLPHTLGLALNFVQLLLRFVYPSRGGGEGGGRDGGGSDDGSVGSEESEETDEEEGEEEDCSSLEEGRRGNKHTHTHKGTTGGVKHFHTRASSARYHRSNSSTTLCEKNKRRSLPMRTSQARGDEKMDTRHRHTHAHTHNRDTHRPGGMWSEGEEVEIEMVKNKNKNSKTWSSGGMNGGGGNGDSGRLAPFGRPPTRIPRTNSSTAILAYADCSDEEEREEERRRHRHTPSPPRPHPPPPTHTHTRATPPSSTYTWASNSSTASSSSASSRDDDPSRSRSNSNAF